MDSLVPTYNDYSKAFGNTLNQEGFNSLLAKAVARVKARCCLIDTTSLTENEQAAYKNAVCIAINALNDPAVSSYTASKVSETYVDEATSGIDDLIEQALSGTRLIEVAL